MECDYEKLEVYLNTSIKGIVNNLSTEMDKVITDFDAISKSWTSEAGDHFVELINKVSRNTEICKKDLREIVTHLQSDIDAYRMIDMGTGILR